MRILTLMVAVVLGLCGCAGQPSDRLPTKSKAQLDYEQTVQDLRIKMGNAWVDNALKKIENERNPYDAILKNSGSEIIWIIPLDKSGRRGGYMLPGGGSSGDAYYFRNDGSAAYLTPLGGGMLMESELWPASK